MGDIAGSFLSLQAPALSRYCGAPVGAFAPCDGTTQAPGVCFAECVLRTTFRLGSGHGVSSSVFFLRQHVRTWHRPERVAIHPSIWLRGIAQGCTRWGSHSKLLAGCPGVCAVPALPSSGHVLPLLQTPAVVVLLSLHEGPCRRGTPSSCLQGAGSCGGSAATGCQDGGMHQ